MRRARSLGTFVLAVGPALVVVALGCSLDRSGQAALGPQPIDDRDGGLDATRDAATTDAESDALDAMRDLGPDARPDARADASDRDTGCADGARVCVDDELFECARGALELVETCVVGCHDRIARCRELVPANVTDPTWIRESEADVVLDAEGSPWTLDTDTGSIIDGTGVATRDPTEGEGVGASGIGFHLDPQSTGPALAVLTMRSLVVEAGARVLVRGVQALVLLASGDVTIDGELDVGAGLDGDRRTPGSGGAAGGESRTSAGGPGSGERGSEEFALESGGGGGGHGGRGGDGGDSTDIARTVQGGSGGDDYDGASPLRGGGGGGGGATSDSGGVGGGGGGALQISVLGTIRIGTDGIVRAPGEGGSGARSFGGAGGGGGAGGTIVFEAPVLVIDGRISANGGGGGGGREGLGTNDGARGSDDASRASGGEGPGLFTGDGGEGGAGADPSGGGAGEANNPGGGGGAAGRLVFRTREPLPALWPTVSPSHESACAVAPLVTR